LLQLQWWNGPSWLKENKEDWHVQKIPVDEDIVQSEKRKTGISMKIVQQEVPWYAKRFSSYYSCVQLIGCIRRFGNNSRKLGERQSGHLTQNEIQDAEHLLLQVIQKEQISSKDSDSWIVCL